LREDAETGKQEREQLRADAEQWRGKFNEAIVNLAAERKTTERVEAAEAELRLERERASALSAKVAAFERGEQERQRAHDAQLAQVKELEGKLEARFTELAGKAVEGAHDQFLKRAEEKFGHAGQQNAEKLQSLLQPVEATLKRYEENLTRVENDRANCYGELNNAVAQLTLGNETVRKETQRLANVMRSSPKARGRWGEEQLRTILESAGLAENVDFTLQSTVSDGERQLRPDCVINLPGDRCIVVDVKCPLVAFDRRSTRRMRAAGASFSSSMRLP
jgi:DNA recombination protein RmuC